ncbi:DNA (cytosine-5-)-methyltransferase [Salarchaeum japonicum]|uniref:DNA (cytosine-5-)-methyltransferase n=1 Tax=Salarchaeum japonicum TaxID=555573 RepID=A0AAV3T1D6_9EURY|nr:DNA (cytosine-5-)-methyltransferase [Salarchaeum japonicum]
MRAIDLFCGAGGFSAGFEAAGIDVLYGCDIAERALDTFDANHDGDGVHHDISEGVPPELADVSVDIVFGSPPCKGFSDARGSRRLDDERNQLVFSFIQWVEHFQPKYVLMENVAGMTTISDEFLEAIEREYADAGYTVDWETLNAADFGVPQTRERVIYVGVRDDLDVEPSLPEGGYRDASDGQLTLSGELMRSWTTVADALEDLPEPTEDGAVSLPPLSDYPENDYLPLVRDGVEETWNHVAKEPSDDEDTRHIVDELRPGEMYRSSRFGDRYRQVWELLSHRFSAVEQDALHFIARHRSRKDFRMNGKSVGAVPDHLIADHLEHDDDSVYDALKRLHADGWIRTDEEDGTLGYDLNTKSGIRPRYMRLTPDGQSNTILTTDFNPRDKLHPTENRGLSLREGARIQSFPDSFRFTGSFDDIATQIGNAVPPLMAQRLAEHLLDVHEHGNPHVTASD